MTENIELQPNIFFENRQPVEFATMLHDIGMRLAQSDKETVLTNIYFGGLYYPDPNDSEIQFARLGIINSGDRDEIFSTLQQLSADKDDISGTLIKFGINGKIENTDWSQLKVPDEETRKQILDFFCDKEVLVNWDYFNVIPSIRQWGGVPNGYNHKDQFAESVVHLMAKHTQDLPATLSAYKPEDLAFVMDLSGKAAAEMIHIFAVSGINLEQYQQLEPKIREFLNNPLNESLVTDVKRRVSNKIQNQELTSANHVVGILGSEFIRLIAEKQFPNRNTDYNDWKRYSELVSGQQITSIADNGTLTLKDGSKISPPYPVYRINEKTLQFLQSDNAIHTLEWCNEKLGLQIDDSFRQYLEALRNKLEIYKQANQLRLNMRTLNKIQQQIPDGENIIWTPGTIFYFGETGSDVKYEQMVEGWLMALPDSKYAVIGYLYTNYESDNPITDANRTIILGTTENRYINDEWDAYGVSNPLNDNDLRFMWVGERLKPLTGTDVDFINRFFMLNEDVPDGHEWNESELFRNDGIGDWMKPSDIFYAEKYQGKNIKYI
jgi:hypothetical protein